jgi:hypothetical protein
MKREEEGLDAPMHQVTTNLTRLVTISSHWNLTGLDLTLATP